jgi:hypothetical protein
MAVEKLTGGFQSLGINIFKGLNLTVAPELIDEGEARKLLNFRMEKLVNWLQGMGMCWAFH